MSDKEIETVTAEVAKWFFDDYLPTWVGVGNRAIDKGPEFILNYWGVPLYKYHPDGGQGALDADRVTGLLNTSVQTVHGGTLREFLDAWDLRSDSVLDEAVELSRGCPIFDSDGSVEVRPIRQM